MLVLSDCNAEFGSLHGIIWIYSILVLRHFELPWSLCLDHYRYLFMTWIANAWYCRLLCIIVTKWETEIKRLVIIVRLDSGVIMMELVHSLIQNSYYIICWMFPYRPWDFQGLQWWLSTEVAHWRSCRILNQAYSPATIWIFQHSFADLRTTPCIIKLF